jgi:hypothetical protein
VTPTLSPTRYETLKAQLVARGYGDDYAWAQAVAAPDTPEAFALEHAFVVCNSGMRAMVAVIIFEKVRGALLLGRPVADVFGHPGKAAGIQHVWDRRVVYFAEYAAAADEVEFLATLPWVGPITKWHLAKNFGVGCVKPDRWLTRLATALGTDPDALCARLAAWSGDRVGTVDVVLWRAATLGLLDDILAEERRT